MSIRSRAPTRVDFAGGTTDLAAFSSCEGGAVVSAAINRYAYCTLYTNGSEGVRIRSQDLDQFVSAVHIRELEFDGNLDLLKAAAKALNVPFGMDITVRCDAPPGSGTGSSASIGVALLGLLDWIRSFQSERPYRLSRFQLAEMACTLEKGLGIVGGKQDQYSAAVGGINYMEFGGEGQVMVEPLALASSVLCDLEKHLILCYSGESRLSGSTNQKMISAYESGDPVVGGALRTVKRVAQDMHRALLVGNLTWFGELMREEWDARRLLAEEVVTDRMFDLHTTAINAGAMGGKVCGAGGGGCQLFLAQPDKEGTVRRALEDADGRIIEFSFDPHGLQVWEGW